MASWDGRENKSPVQEESDNPKIEPEFPLADYNADTVTPLPPTYRHGTEHEDTECSNTNNGTESSFIGLHPDNIAEAGTPWTEHEHSALELRNKHVVQDGAPDDNVSYMHQMLRNSRETTSDLSSSFDRMSLKSLRSSSFSGSVENNCNACEVINKAMPSKDSEAFWQSVPEAGLSIDRCHVKQWEKFERILKENYPEAAALKSKQTMAFMKKLLGVEEGSKLASIKYDEYLKLVKFFGPMKNEDPVMLRQLHELVQKSQITRKTPRGRKEKISWFAGFMNREEAETILKKEKDGTYLIRMSQSQMEEASFVVSVNCEDIIEHFEIEQDYKKAALSEPFSAHLSLDKRTFNTLIEVAGHLLHNPLKDEDGLDIWCRHICPGLPLNGVIAGYKSTRGQ